MNQEWRKVHRPVHSSLSELNITPLLDLVFVLLVIFIITTPQLTNNLELNLPSRQPAPPVAEKPKITHLYINSGGKILLNEMEMAMDQLSPALAALKASDPSMNVLVHAASEADYQTVVDVLDVFQQLRITKVGLATDVASDAGK